MCSQAPNRSLASRRMVGRVSMAFCFYLWVIMQRVNTLLLCPGSVCVSMCVSVCLFVHEHISGTAESIFVKFNIQIPCGRGLVLLWRRCDTL